MERSALADPLVGQVIDRRYRVESLIARGGMAAVYTAVDLRLDRRVALKVVTPPLAGDPAFAARFVREARAAARLASPHVVAVYDQGEDGGVLFLAMEYVDGRRTLRDVIREQAPLAPVRALALVEDVLQALASAHEAGIMHRDIKPENVLIDPRGRVKVADFGLARAVGAVSSLTTTGGVLMGTVSYVPPEVVVDGTADARSDVYAVGVVLFELLTGTKPHVGDSPLEVAYRHVHEDVPPPSARAPGIPPYVDALVARATARRRELRPADASVLLHQVRRVRSALEHGLTDDVELTADLTPTIAVGSARSTREPAGASSLYGGPATVPPDEVFDQEAFGSEARTLVVGSAASRTSADAGSGAETTMTVPAGATALAAPAPSAPPYSPPDLLGPSGPPLGPRRSRSRAGWIALLLVLLLAAAAAFVGWQYGASRYQSMPDVVGMRQEAAAARLQASGLVLDVTRTEYSERVPDGRLISTEPRPGQDVLAGGTVHGVVSRGPERHAVPQVSGLTAARAIAAVRRAHLQPTAPRRVWSDSVPAGHVVSVTPSAGTLLARGHAVTVTVSRGPRLVEVPDVRMSGIEAAEQALRDAGFRYRVHDTSLSLGLGVVVKQSPDGGQQAPYGSTVDIYVV